MPSTAKPPSRLQGGTHAQGGSEAVSSACGGSADHGHRDEDTVQSVPTRRGAFAGWDAQGGELPYRRLLGDELAGDAVRPRPRRAWWGAGLGRRSGGDWDGDDLSLTTGSRCATQLDRPGGMGVAEEVEQLELERDEVQELPMLLRPGSVVRPLCVLAWALGCRWLTAYSDAVARCMTCSREVKTLTRPRATRGRSSRASSLMCVGQST